MPSVPSVSSPNSHCSMCGSSEVHQEDAGFFYCYPCWKGEDYLDKYKDDPYDRDNFW